MRYLRHLLFSAIIVVAAGVFAGGHALAISPRTIIDLTNQQRAANGLPALSENADLMASAAAKARDMIGRDYWAHFAPDGTSPWYFIDQSGYKYRAAGENLAMDFSDDQSLVTAWMASPEHRSNILNPTYQDIGVAVIDGSLLGHQTTLVVEHFGVPATAQAVSAPSAPLPGFLNMFKMAIAQLWLTPIAKLRT